jgi:hypothetical protein
MANGTEPTGVVGLLVVLLSLGFSIFMIVIAILTWDNTNKLKQICGKKA